jgi:predicted ATPase
VGGWTGRCYWDVFLFLSNVSFWRCGRARTSRRFCLSVCLFHGVIIVSARTISLRNCRIKRLFLFLYPILAQKYSQTAWNRKNHSSSNQTTHSHYTHPTTHTHTPTTQRVRERERERSFFLLFLVTLLYYTLERESSRERPIAILVMMMELDFTRIPWCGRQDEVQQLQRILRHACTIPTTRTTEEWNVQNDTNGNSRDDNDDNDDDNDDDVRNTDETTTTTTLPLQKNKRNDNHHHHHHPTDTTTSSSSPSRPRIRSVVVQGAAGSGKTALIEHVLDLERRRMEHHHHHDHHGTNSGVETKRRKFVTGYGTFDENESTTTTTTTTNNTNTNNTTSQTEHFPFATIADCLTSMIQELYQYDPHWVHQITHDEPKMDLLILSSIAPSLQKVMDDLLPSSSPTRTTTLRPTTPADVAPYNTKNNHNDDAKKLLPTSSQQPQSPYDKLKSFQNVLTQRSIRILHTVTDTSPPENHRCFWNRICLALQRWIRFVQYQLGYAVVFVVENIQWANPESIQLINAFLLQEEEEEEEDSQQQHQQPSQNLLCIMTMTTTTTTTTTTHCEKEEEKPNKTKDVSGPSIVPTSNDDEESSSSSQSLPRLLQQLVPPQQQCTITLNDLTVTEVAIVLSHLLRRQSEESSKMMDLARVVHSKTRGTVWFVLQFVRRLVEQKLLYYSMTTTTTTTQYPYQWEFVSVDRIVAETTLADNVVQLVCDKIASLPVNLQLPLITASFLGSSRFEAHVLLDLIPHAAGILLPTLSTTVTSRRMEEDEDGVGGSREENNECSTPPHPPTPPSMIYDLTELCRLLDLAVQEGLLTKLPSPPKGCYKFSHGRVREGALALVPTNDGQDSKLHLQVGKELVRIRQASIVRRNSKRKGFPENAVVVDDDVRVNDDDNHETSRDDDTTANDDTDVLVFLSVRHLNAGVSRMKTKQELVELSQLNLKAAQLLMRQAAFRPAIHFLQIGLRVLDRHSRWVNHYDLTLQLSTSLSRCRFCRGLYQENWSTIQDVLKHTRCIEDKVGVYMTWTQSLFDTGRVNEAFETCRMTLGELGIEIPRKYLRLHIAQAFFQLRLKLRTRTEENLVPKRIVTPEDVIFVQVDFLTTLFHCARIHGQREISLIAVLQLACILLDRGCEELAQLTFATVGYAYGCMQAWKKMYQYGKLAVQAANERRRIKEDLRTTALTYHDILLWKE